MNAELNVMFVVPDGMAGLIRDIAGHMDGDTGAVAQCFMVMGLHSWAQVNDLPGLSTICAEWLFRYAERNGLAASVEYMQRARTWQSDLADDR